MSSHRNLSVIVGSTLFAFCAACTHVRHNNEEMQQWDKKFIEAARQRSVQETAVKYLQLAATAPDRKHYCEALGKAVHFLSQDNSRNTKTVLMRAIEMCPGPVALKARYYLAIRLIAHSHEYTKATKLLVQIILDEPASYWAQLSVHTLFANRRHLFSGQAQFFSLFRELAQFDRLRARTNFLMAKAYANKGDFESTVKATRLALLVAYTEPSSPLWDDSILLAADLLRKLGRTGDEIEFLNDMLIPTPGRDDPVLLRSSLYQKLRLRLAKLLIKSGKFSQAHRLLWLVVNYHPGWKHKQEAVATLAALYCMEGEKEKAKAIAHAFLKRFSTGRYRKKMAKIVENPCADQK